MTINSKGQLIVTTKSVRSVRVRRRANPEAVMLGYVVFVAVLFGFLKLIG
jgi:hypothetical protein